MIPIELSIPAAATALGTCVAIYAMFGFIFHSTPLNALPGPSAGSWLLGQYRAIQEHHDDELYERWFKQHGHVVAHKTLFGKTTLLTNDLRAIQHILSHSDVFPRTPFARRFLSRALGNGLLVAEGDHHRAQRRLLNSAFGPTQLQELSGIFLSKGNELREHWVSQLSSSGRARVNVVEGVSATTLDIIGLAGFGFAFNALVNPSERLTAAFSPTAASPDVLSLVLLGTMPGARWLPTRTLTSRRRSRTTMERIGRELLEERKMDTDASLEEASRRDLLSLLVSANFSEESSQRLSDHEVIAQIMTFITAGHETTSTAITWTLFELAQHLDVQLLLRDELRSFPIPTAIGGVIPLDAGTLAALEKLPLLDAVVRETLRVHATLPNITRVAAKDTVIPLAQPFVDKHGTTRDVIRIQHGDLITVPILNINRLEQLWGADAREWRPQRWFVENPISAKRVPGIWGHIMTFSGGSHACIGYRFALMEMKIVLHALVTSLCFELAVPVDAIAKKSTVITRPVLANAREQGIQLPLFIARAI